jgi:hypothetical protein|tara:strand:- start:355 stop:915 length:561 start_codon:yes stop_codon:yes gene_type:complete
MFLYGTWYFLHIQDFANLRLENEWAGSFVFLPHGARVLMVCFFRYYSLPALYLADITGPSIMNHEQYQVTYVEGSNIAALGCIAAVILSVELIKWSRVSEGKFSFFKPVNFKNYKFLFLVVVLSSLLSGVICNSIISIINDQVSIDVLTVLRFMVGDFIGAVTVIALMWIVFTTAIDNRLILSPEK